MYMYRLFQTQYNVKKKLNNNVDFSWKMLRLRPRGKNHMVPTDNWKIVALIYRMGTKPCCHGTLMISKRG